jgi:murein DD-endopeptidase MepM/ murein hydrolase activator NlpD
LLARAIGNDTVNVMYRLCNASSRALWVLAAVLALGVLMGSQANAEEPTTPRAIPVARTFPRSFTTYDALIAYATGIAADQNALDLRAAGVARERDVFAAAVDPGIGSPHRGGRLADPDSQGDAPSAAAQARARVRDLAAIDRKLVAAGALTSPATAWRLPTEGQITQPFGPSTLWMEPARTHAGVFYAHFHEGLDIAGAWSADVVAPARARVVFAGRMGDGAQVVVLAHDGGVVTMYAHLNASDSPPRVAAGDEVAAGQVIGTVGTTGMVTGMHLHWAAFRNGELIDPMSLIGH